MLAATAGLASEQDDTVFFESKIRPILATSCYSCHTGSALGGLRLDSREALLKGGKSGPSIVSGDPDSSLLITAVRQTGPLKMPMGAKLTKDQIEDLTKWVKTGAFWPVAAKTAAPASGKYVITKEQRAFWSFQPVHVSPAPATVNKKWPRNEIDRFILARLEKENLAPVSAADRRTLIRRATLDLTGLPPTFEEIDAFEKDKSADAFAKVIDRLLECPNYGERWGRIWLDVARYGEDDYRSLDPMGRGHNPYPMAYLYRDWVIKAFNEDLPYDQFVKAQLAADSMDEAKRARVLPALGFLGQGPWFYDNGAVEITHADARHDRIDVVSRGFLGLTAGCARCHDHKYDPIPTTDYYALGGVFASTSYQEYPMVPKAVAADYDKQEKKVKAKERMLGEFMEAETDRLAESLAMQASKYMVAAWKVTGEPKTELTKVVDENKLDFELMGRWVKFLARPPKNYPNLKDWQAMIQRGGTAEEAKKLGDEFQTLLLELVFDKKEVNDENEIRLAKSLAGLKKREPLFKPSDFKTNDDFCPACAVELKTMPLERSNLWMDVFKIDLEDPQLPGVKYEFKPGLLVFRGWGLERQLSADKRQYINGLKDDIEKTKKDMPPHYPFVHGAADEPAPVDLKVNLRGNPFSLGADVPRGFLSVLSPADQPIHFSKGSGRMELAEAILAQPLAMRVIVNRVWKGHFGTGIVDSPSNFGVTGERPVHPELLEYLADSFTKNGMSIKKLHREIMLSSVYQLSNEFSQTNFDKDSGNRLYWRFNRRRMDAEQVRDSLLAVSGQLENKQFGPSAPLTPQYNRRTVYGKVSRYKLDDYLQLFDFPAPNISAEQRFSTNVPMQRLFFMNSDFVQQQGEYLAKRLEDEPDTASKIQKAYKLTLGRAATPEEVQLGVEYLKNEPLKEYEERKAAAEKKEKEAKEKAAKAVKDGMPGPPEPVAVKGSIDKMKPSGAESGMDPNGMMAGVVPGDEKDSGKKPLLPVSTWGRYAKVLLSSTEFIFIN
ncbi:MAG: PSD1 and planctomycete cytochrome C domain-containing protein [Bryobacteraceae bacterium]